MAEVTPWPVTNVAARVKKMIIADSIVVEVAEENVCPDGPSRLGAGAGQETGSRREWVVLVRMEMSRSTGKLVPRPADNFQRPTASCHGDVGKPQYGQVVKIKVKDPWRIRTESLGKSTLDAQTRSSKFRPVDLRLLLLKMTASTVST